MIQFQFLGDNNKSKASQNTKNMFFSCLSSQIVLRQKKSSTTGNQNKKLCHRYAKETDAINTNTHTHLNLYYIRREKQRGKPDKYLSWPLITNN